MKLKIRKTIKDMTNVQLMKRHVKAQKKSIAELKESVHRLNHLVKDDILALTTRSTTYKGNDYQTYDRAVVEINAKYNGAADWGVIQTGAIIDLRAAFIIGEGIKIVANEKGAEKEKEWAEAFLKYNDLDMEGAQEWAKEAEIEGKLAIKLALDKVKEADDKEKLEVTARYVSWTENNYKIETAAQDYMKYEKMTWTPKAQDKVETLEEKDFVYKKFGGRINKPNLAVPKIMRCLTQIEGLDKALRDWREIDRIFAGPILAAECKDKEDVKSAREALSDKNWKIDKIFVSTATLYFAQFDIKGVESIENEIITLSKMISGTTGVPVHFLGFPDLMSNRAVAENLMELIHATTTKERTTWIGAFEELITKAMLLYNAKVNAQMSEGSKLDPKKISVEIPMITKEHWAHLEKLYLPAAIAGKISVEAFQSQIPGFDMDAEKERQKEKDASDLERIKKENEDLRTDLTNKEVFGGSPSPAKGVEP